MESFVYEALPTRVVFGSGTIARIREEFERLGARRALVLSTPGRGEGLANEVSLLLRDLSAGVHAGAVMHTPIDATEKALSVVRERAADAAAVPEPTTVAMFSLGLACLGLRSLNRRRRGA